MSKSGNENIPRLMTQYKKEIVPKLMKRFGYKNIHQVPKITKICLNIGVGEATQDAKFLDGSVADLTVISGQKPVITRAKKSISNFKLREGNPIGCRVTLRRLQMYEFLDRLFNGSIPRIRDFRGLPDKGFDGKGNFTLGIKEQIVFPEIEYDKVVKIRGLNITFVTTAANDEEAFALLTEFGMPFRNRDKYLNG